MASVTRPAGWWTGYVVKYETIFKRDTDPECTRIVVEDSLRLAAMVRGSSCNSVARASRQTVGHLLGNGPASIALPFPNFTIGTRRKTKGIL